MMDSYLDICQSQKQCVIHVQYLVSEEQNAKHFFLC